jgi:uncharacterized protein
VHSTHILVFARRPLPGLAKTRLIGPGLLTPEQAAELHAAMIADTLALLANVPIPAERRLLMDAAPAGVAIPPGFRLGFQTEGGLGQRLIHAIGESFANGAHAVAVVGSDTPHLPAARLAQALIALRVAGAVYGPAEDGGFYLAAFRAAAFTPGLLEGIDWGTERVLDQALAAAARWGVAIELLPEFYDLDRWEDLQRLLHQPPPGLQTVALARRWMRASGSPTEFD